MTTRPLFEFEQDALSACMKRYSDKRKADFRWQLFSRIFYLLLLLSIVLVFVLLFVAICMAQTVAPQVVAPAGSTGAQVAGDGAIVFFQPLIQQAMPYIVFALCGVLTWLFGKLVTAAAPLLKKWGFNIDQQSAVDSFGAAAKRQANIWIASQQGAAWMHQSLDIHDQWFADAANTVIARMPDNACKAGMTPEKFAEWIVAEIGAAQAEAQAKQSPIIVPPAPAAPAPSPTLGPSGGGGSSSVDPETKQVVFR